MSCIQPESVFASKDTPSFHEVDVDQVVWKPYRSKDHSVRSNYRFCFEELMNTSGYNIPGNLKLLWNPAVPPKLDPLFDEWFVIVFLLVFVCK
jgi:hypothetical protein